MGAGARNVLYSYQNNQTIVLTEGMRSCSWYGMKVCIFVIMWKAERQTGKQQDKEGRFKWTGSENVQGVEEGSWELEG